MLGPLRKYSSILHWSHRISCICCCLISATFDNIGQKQLNKDIHFSLGLYNSKFSWFFSYLSVCIFFLSPPLIPYPQPLNVSIMSDLIVCLESPPWISSLNWFKVVVSIYLFCFSRCVFLIAYLILPSWHHPTDNFISLCKREIIISPFHNNLSSLAF